MAAHVLAGAKNTSWLGWHLMAPRKAQGLGAGQHLSGLDPRDVGLGLCLCTSVCQISLESETKMEVSLS